MLTFQFRSTLGIAPFAAAPDTVGSAEEIILLKMLNATNAADVTLYPFGSSLSAFKILADPLFFGMPGFLKSHVTHRYQQQDTTFGTIFI